MSSNFTTVTKLIHAARAAIDRGDMYVGQEEDFPDLRSWAAMIEIPITIQRGKVLLCLKKPKLAVNSEGEVVSICTVHEGVYYTRGGATYSINEIAWLEDKELNLE